MGIKLSYLYEMKIKLCSKCKIEQNIDQFNKNARSKDQLDYWCRSCNIQSTKNWLANNPNKKAEQSKIASQREKTQRNNPETRERILEYSRRYYQQNKEKVIQRTMKYSSDKYRTNPHFKTLSLLRSRILHALKNYKGVKKAAKTVELIGCSIETLKLHLESQFTEGMTWENQGKWHIDHIKPCASFDLTQQDQQKQCFHYTNLQPLWALDNHKKSNK